MVPKGTAALDASGPGHGPGCGAIGISSGSARHKQLAVAAAGGGGGGGYRGSSSGPGYEVVRVGPTTNFVGDAMSTGAVDLVLVRGAGPGCVWSGNTVDTHNGRIYVCVLCALRMTAPAGGALDASMTHRQFLLEYSITPLHYILCSPPVKPHQAELEELQAPPPRPLALPPASSAPSAFLLLPPPLHQPATAADLEPLGGAAGGTLAGVPGAAPPAEAWAALAARRGRNGEPSAAELVELRRAARRLLGRG